MKSKQLLQQIDT